MKTCQSENREETAAWEIVFSRRIFNNKQAPLIVLLEENAELGGGRSTMTRLQLFFLRRYSGHGKHSPVRGIRVRVEAVSPVSIIYRSMHSVCFLVSLRRRSDLRPDFLPLPVPYRILAGRIHQLFVIFRSVCPRNSDIF